MSSALRGYVGKLKAEVAAGTAPWHRTKQPADQALPFITIARQAGAGGRTLAHKLAQRLNGKLGDDGPWRPWDRELVEHIAKDHDMSAALIDRLEDSGSNWFRELLSVLDSSTPSPLAITRRMVESMRALAQSGRVILVGRGGVFITREMPQGIHIHLVAPLAYRIEQYAREMNLGQAEAAGRVAEIDQNRADYYQRYFRQASLDPSLFHLTINTAVVSLDLAAELVAQLVPSPKPGRVAGAV